MARELAWWVVGVTTGIVLAGLYRRVKDEQKAEDIDALARSIDKQLDLLERQMTGG